MAGWIWLISCFKQAESNAESDDGFTVLMWAAARGHIEVFKTLLESVPSPMLGLEKGERQRILPCRKVTILLQHCFKNVAHWPVPKKVRSQDTTRLSRAATSSWTRGNRARGQRKDNNLLAVWVLMSWCRLNTLTPVTSWTMASITGRAVSISWVRTCLSRSRPSRLANRRTLGRVGQQVPTGVHVA